MSTIDFLKIFGPYLSALVIALSAGIAWRAFNRSQHLSLFQKCVDTISHCNTRYESLIVDLSSKAKADKINAEVYFRKYWGLQSDQFDYFTLGLVDPLTFTTWNVSLIRHFRDKEHVVDEMDFENSWNKVGRPKGAESDLFVRFIDALLKKANDPSCSMGDRQYCMSLARDIYDRPEVRRFRTHMMERDPTNWDWSLELFSQEPPRI